MKKTSSIAVATVLGLALTLTAKAGVGLGGAFQPAGSDTSGPEIYIIYNGTTTSISVASPDQGPYDGVEDTYIGVVNTSTTATLGSVNLSGGGIGLFQFDGDGISTYLAGATDSSGYAGPNTSFSNINLGADTGTVNFTGGLAPGATAYFSLEEAIAGAVSSGGVTVQSGPAPDACSSMALLGGSLAGVAAMRRRFKL